MMMTLRRDLYRWLVYAIIGTVCLITGQLFWLLQFERGPDSIILRDNYKFEREENPSKRATFQSEIEDLTKDSTFHNKTSYVFDEKRCTPDLSIFSKDIKTPFKLYIYDLPAKFNQEILYCLKKWSCFHLEYCGMGPELYNNNNISVRHTNQFSLEVVLHHQMLFSAYRTLNPDEADVFYIPAYTGLACFCHDRKHSDETRNLIKELFDWLNNQEPYASGKLHISTLAKIQREQASEHCPLLRHPEAWKIIYAMIEEESSKSSRHYHHLAKQRAIVVPYPSYSHMIQGSRVSPNAGHVVSTSQDRRVFILFAAGSRRSNLFRGKLIDQFNKTARTTLSYDKFFEAPENGDTDMVMLFTRECNGNHHYTTTPWMQHSVFCLQPPGDSPTRKSFYDSILAGCIPVLFQDSNIVRYPFQDSLNYTDFTVSLALREIDEKNLQVKKLLKKITLEEIRRKQKTIAEVARGLQFSWPTGSLLRENDALGNIMEEIEKILISN